MQDVAKAAKLLEFIAFLIELDDAERRVLLKLAERINNASFHAAADGAGGAR